MLTREQLVSSILSINLTASVEFLAKFDTVDLRRYFERLQLTQEPRDVHSTWRRPDDMCAFSAAA